MKPQERVSSKACFIPGGSHKLRYSKFDADIYVGMLRKLRTSSSGPLIALEKAKHVKECDQISWRDGWVGYDIYDELMTFD